MIEGGLRRDFQAIRAVSTAFAIGNSRVAMHRLAILLIALSLPACQTAPNGNGLPEIFQYELPEIFGYDHPEIFEPQIGQEAEGFDLKGLLERLGLNL